MDEKHIRSFKELIEQLKKEYEEMPPERKREIIASMMLPTALVSSLVPIYPESFLASLVALNALLALYYKYLRSETSKKKLEQIL